MSNLSHRRSERETLDSPFNSSQRRSVKTRLSPFFCVGDEEEEEEIQSIFLHPRGPFWLFPPILLRTDQSPPPLPFQGSPSPTKVSFSNSHFFKRKVLAAAGIRTLSTLFPRRGGENVMSSIEPRKVIQYIFLQKFHLRHLECQCQGTTGTFRSCLSRV